MSLIRYYFNMMLDLVKVPFSFGSEEIVLTIKHKSDKLKKGSPKRKTTSNVKRSK